MNRGAPPVATAQEGLINEDIHLGKNHHEEYKKYIGSDVIRKPVKKLAETYNKNPFIIFDISDPSIDS